MKHAPRILLISAIVLLPHFAFAATMSVLPSTQQATVGGLITARISIDSGGVAINQGQADITYPANLLTVVSVSKSSSIFTFWVTDPTNSTGDGIISFDAGLPTPGYSGSDGTVVTIVFQAIGAGTANIGLGNPAVRANDGLGTDVLTGISPATFVITAPTQTSIPVTTVSTPTTSTPAAPAAPTPSTAGVTLSSKTNPDQTAWYSNNNPTIEWSVPSDASEVEVVASIDKNAAPSITYASTTFEKQLNGLTDGTWYFNLRYRLNGVWSALSSYIFNIDTTPPVVDSESFSYDASQRALILSIKAHDDTSGIASYDLTIDSGKPVELSANEFSNGPYVYPIATAGNHTLVLRVLDKAGNYTDVPGTFSVPQPLLDTPVFTIGEFPIRLWYILLAMGIVSLLSLLIAIVALYKLYTYHAQPRTRRVGQRKDVHKAFSLLREDLNKNLKVLKKARTGKDLTVAETDLGQTMHSDLNDFEKYLNEQTDLLE